MGKRRFILAVVAVILSFGAGATTSAAVIEGQLLDRDSAAVGVLDEAAELTFMCEAEERACQLAHHMLETFPFPWTVLDYEVVIRDFDDGEWIRGLAIPDERRIELYVSEDTTITDLAATFAHEVGHALHQICGQAALDEWRERRDLDETVPDYVDPPHDYDSVAEDFAEAFRQFLGYGPSQSTVGDDISNQWLHLNAELFIPGECPNR